MKKPKTSIVALVCCGSFVLQVIAGELRASEEVLRFASAWQRFEPTPEDSTVTASFHFTNVSSRRVVVTGHPTCSCTSVQTDREVYEPGQAGTFTGVFTIGTLSGILVKPIPFSTDHPDQPTGVVTMELSLPPAPIIQRSLMIWVVGEAPAPKTFQIILRQGYRHAFIGAHATDAAFDAKMTADAALPGYLVTVTPVTTDHPANATIVLQTDCARTFETLAVVRGSDAVIEKP